VSKLTREQVTVVLTGDGGDELFAGYRRFWAAVSAERWPLAIRRAGRALTSLVPPPRHERHAIASVQRFFAGATQPLEVRATRWNALFYEDVGRLVRPEVIGGAGFDPMHYAARERERLARLTPLSRLLHLNFSSYLVDDLLVKTDRCTMANSLEARSPFLDHALIDYVAALPDQFKLNGRRTKAVLRDAFADLIPPEIDRRPKMGFGVPVGTWFRTSLKDYACDVLLAPSAKYADVLNRSYVETLLTRHLSGESNAGPQLWALIAFERWLQLLPEWEREGRRAQQHEHDGGERNQGLRVHG
jgi:asparagine synthase (glutamine-hydrolysing)